VGERERDRNRHDVHERRSDVQRDHRRIVDNDWIGDAEVSAGEPDEFEREVGERAQDDAVADEASSHARAIILPVRACYLAGLPCGRLDFSLAPWSCSPAC
jgi:hypothetical protein